MFKQFECPKCGQLANERGETTDGKGKLFRCTSPLCGTEFLANYEAMAVREASLPQQTPIVINTPVDPNKVQG